MTKAKLAPKPKAKEVLATEVARVKQKAVLHPKRKSHAPANIQAEVFQGETAMTMQQAMDLIGWEVVELGGKGKQPGAASSMGEVQESKAWKDRPGGPIDKPKKVGGMVGVKAGGDETKGTKWHLKDHYGNKVLLRGNSTNRPYRPGLAKRYRDEFLRNKWALNGESIIFDCADKCQSGQHRLAGYIMACQAYAEKPEKYKKYGWNRKLECVVITGISDKPEVVDTIDQGQKRTGGDVIYRSDIFTAETDSKKRRLSNILSGAARLVWLRSGGKTVSDAPHFPVSEMMEFITLHPKLVQHVERLLDLDGSGESVGKIGKKISIGYAAGLSYMMSVSATDSEEFKDVRSAALDFKMEKKADEFWLAFATGENLPAGSPILALREKLPDIDGGSATGRDEKTSTVIKAFNLWMDKKQAKAKDIAIRRTRNGDGVEVLAEDPKLGGIDIDIEGEDVEHGGETDLDKFSGEDTEREGEMHGKSWAEGDTAWVKEAGGAEPWFGTVGGVYKTVKGMEAIVTDAREGKDWEVMVKCLHLKYPG